MELTTNITLSDFQKSYFLKNELVTFCKSVGISTFGGKREISDRIENFLKTGEKTITTECVKTNKSKSHFNWNTAELSLNTIITDNYKNTENVRSFFKQQIGDKFHFNTQFMNWAKANTGKTLQDAVNEYHKIKKESKTTKTEIAPQFEYNAFIRSYFAENQGKTLKDAIKEWKKYKYIK